MQEYGTAENLPEGWDEAVGDNIYLRRDFLTFMERAGDVESTRYYAYTDAAGKLAGGGMFFYRNDCVINQFMNRAPLTVRAGYAYVPLSVSRPGMFGCAEAQATLCEYIRRHTKGLQLIFNVPEGVQAEGFCRVTTCPRCVLDLRWPSFEAYLAAMRSNYRNRYTKALKRSAGLRIRLLADNREFDDALHALYLQVHQRADYKIEQLSREFFRGDFFKIFVVEDQAGTPVAFYQLLENGEELIFEFTGFDAEAAKQHDAYVRMLLEIVRYGLENGFRRIDFGQTAEEAKLKLGCRYEKLSVLARHSNPLFNGLLRLCTPLLHYKPLAEGGFNVFKRPDAYADVHEHAGGHIKEFTGGQTKAGV